MGVKLLLRFIACLAVAAITSVGFAGVAWAGAPNVDPCKNGGYVSYTDPATGQAFATQGRCVSTVARGGALLPVLGPVTVGGYDTESTVTGPWGTCDISVSFTGTPNANYPVTWLTNGQVAQTSSAVTASDGSGSSTATLPDGPTVTLVINSQMFDVGVLGGNCHVPLRFHSYSGTQPSNPDWCEHVVLTLEGAPPGASENFAVSFFMPNGSSGGVNHVTGYLDANGLISFHFDQPGVQTDGALEKGTVVKIVDWNTAPDSGGGRPWVDMPATVTC